MILHKTNSYSLYVAFSVLEFDFRAICEEIIKCDQS